VFVPCFQTYPKYLELLLGQGHGPLFFLAKKQIGFIIVKHKTTSRSLSAKPLPWQWPYLHLHTLQQSSQPLNSQLTHHFQNSPPLTSSSLLVNPPTKPATLTFLQATPPLIDHGALRFLSFLLSWKRARVLRSSRRNFLRPLIPLIVEQTPFLKTNKELMRLVHSHHLFFALWSFFAVTLKILLRWSFSWTWAN